MPETKRQKERLVALLIFGIIVMNYPVLSLFSRVMQWQHIPVLFLYIFFCWAVFIICVAFVIEKPPSPLSTLKIRDRGKVD